MSDVGPRHPLVSICIATYNGAPFVAETLESALSQDYPNVEVVVSDDCSRDETAEIISSFAHRGVRLLQLQENIGRYANYNAVIRASLGKYAVNLDQDDLLEPNHVSEQTAVLESDPGITFAHCACQLIDLSGRRLGYERALGKSFVRGLEEEWVRYLFGPRAVNIVTIRRSTFDRVGGYDERYRFSGDWAMHRALLLQGRVFYNDKVLASYRVHPLGKQGSKRMQAHDRLLHIESMEKEWPESVAGKAELLGRVRRRLALVSLLGAAQTEGAERQEILDLIPHYTEDPAVRILAALLPFGAGILLRSGIATRNYLRLLLKPVLLRLQRPHETVPGVQAVAGQTPGSRWGVGG